MIAPMHERRIHTRVLPMATRPVELQIIGNGFLEVVQIEDISIGGVAIQVPHSFVGCNIKDELDLLLTLPNNPTFKARGVVRHRANKAEGTLFGVQFTVLNEKGREKIEKYVELMVAYGRRC